MIKRRVSHRFERGGAKLEFEDGSMHELGAGDYLNILAGCRHKVCWADPQDVTIWLTVFYD